MPKRLLLVTTAACLTLSAPAIALAAEPSTAAQQHQQAEPGAALASLEEMVGATVRGADGAEIGRVTDVIYNPEDGTPQQLVIATGGDGKQIAIDFDGTELALDEGLIVAPDVSKSDVQEMEEFRYDADVTSLKQGTGAARTRQ